MKILITGSNGMLGTDLSALLAEDNHIVGVDITDPPDPERMPHSFHKASITDAARMMEVMEEETPELVIHTAAWADVDGCEKEPKKAEEVNTKGTFNTAKAAARVGAPMIFISTDFVFNGKKTTPYSETDTPDPISVYGRTKYEAERELESIMGSYVILRISWLFGRNGKNFVNTIISKAGFQNKISVVNDQTGSPTYTKDISQAIRKLLETDLSSRRDIFHVSNSGSCSWYEFAKRILEVKGIKRVKVEPVSSKDLARPAARPPFSVLDNTKFETETGYMMRPWQEALEVYLKNG